MKDQHENTQASDTTQLEKPDPRIEKGLETFKAFLDTDVIGQIVAGQRVFGVTVPSKCVTDPRAWGVTIGPVNSNHPQYQRKIPMQNLWGRAEAAEIFLKYFPPTLDLLTEELATQLNKKYQGSSVKGRNVSLVVPANGFAGHEHYTDDVRDPRKWKVVLDPKFIDTNVAINLVEVPGAEEGDEPLYTVQAGEPHPDAQGLHIPLTGMLDEKAMQALFQRQYGRLTANEIPLMQRTGFIAKFQRLFS